MMSLLALVFFVDCYKRRESYTQVLLCPYVLVGPAKFFLDKFVLLANNSKTTKSMKLSSNLNSMSLVGLERTWILSFLNTFYSLN